MSTELPPGVAVQDDAPKQPKRSPATAVSAKPLEPVAIPVQGEESDLIRSVAECYRLEASQGEDLLREIAEADRKPNYAETVFFARECGWEEKSLNGRLRRMRSVMRFQAIAGSAADREAAVVEADKSANLLKTEGPKIQAEIEKQQAKLKALEDDRRRAAKRVNDHAEAVKQLRDLLPEHVLDEYNSRKRLINASLRREMFDKNTRMKQLQTVLGVDGNDAPPIEIVQRFAHKAVTTNPLNGRLEFSPEWPAIKSKAEEELAELTPQATALAEQYEAERAELEELRNYYC